MKVVLNMCTEDMQNMNVIPKIINYQDQEQSKQLEQKKHGSTCIAEVQEVISEALVV